MCEPASFIVTKDKVFWSKTSFSHENIITENNLEILDADVENIGLVRVEITPPNRDFSKPSRLWTYKVDQDLLPSWYDVSVEKRVRKELAKWRKWHFATQTAGDDSTQKAGDRSTQKAGDGSTQTAGYYSTQKAGDGSTQKAGDRSTQTAGYYSTQTAGYRSTQTAGYRSTQTAGYRSTQTAGDDSTQTAGYGSTQTAGYRSTQAAGDQTVQIIRFWKDDQMQVKVRTITEAEANQWYVFKDGDWRLCTDAEAARAEEECG